MAFISLLFVMALLGLAVLAAGVVPVIIGTCIRKKHPRIGIFLRILGYLFLVPTLFFGMAMLISWLVSAIGG